MKRSPADERQPNRPCACPAAAALALLAALVVCEAARAQGPALPTKLTVQDRGWDGGEQIQLRIWLSPDDVPPARGAKPDPAKEIRYKVFRAAEVHGEYKEVASVKAEKKDYRNGYITLTVDKCVTGQGYHFLVAAVGPGNRDAAIDELQFISAPGPVPARPQLLDGERMWMALITLLFCGAVVYWIRHVRKGRPLKVRKIAGLSAVDEAVGRATEMGRSCLFIPGIQDMKDIQTIAGITVLARVAKTAAEYGARVEVPTARSLVMTTARETVQQAFLEAGRPDAYNEDDVYYVTDEQFGYVAYLSGMMVREKPAACFYMGSFFAESLILAETGNSVGAIQVAGTAQPAQLPFFVAACDYTLIGEEFFAASAYLSGSPEQLGSLKGQDVGKVIVGVLLLIGCGIATWAALTPEDSTVGLLARDLLDYLKEIVLK